MFRKLSVGWPSPKESENIGQLSTVVFTFFFSGTEKTKKDFFSIFQVLMQSRAPIKTGYPQKGVSLFLVSTLLWPNLQETEHQALETCCGSVKDWKQEIIPPPEACQSFGSSLDEGITVCAWRAAEKPQHPDPSHDPNLAGSPRQPECPWRNHCLFWQCSRTSALANWQCQVVPSTS